jgi:hypothetical protein
MTITIIHQLTQPQGRAWGRSIPTVETGCDGRAEYLSILPGKPVEKPTPEEPHDQWLAVVHDIVALGSAGFDQPALKRLAGRATHLALVYSEPDRSIYRVFASTPAALGRVLVVETTLAVSAAWGRFLSRHTRLPLLLACLPEGRRS